MAKVDRLHRVGWLYHFTDDRNLQSIIDLDGLWSTAKLHEKGVTFHPGGNQHSLDADQMFGMDEYVHLCFTKKHPMAYLAQKDGRIEKLQWIYVEDPAAVFEIEGVRYCTEVSNKPEKTLMTLHCLTTSIGASMKIMLVAEVPKNVKSSCRITCR